MHMERIFGWSFTGCLDVWHLFGYLNGIILCVSLGILLYPCLTPFVISIGVVLVFVLIKYFDISTEYILWSSVDLALCTLIITLMGPLLGNYIVIYLGMYFYFYMTHL